MAHATSYQGTGPLAHIVGTVGAALRAVGLALTVNASAEARLREVTRLQGLSDEELAARGLTRDRIVQHVFRDIIMI